MRTRMTTGLLFATLTGCGGDNVTKIVSQDGGGSTPGGPYLPLGASLLCADLQKVSGVDANSGNVICADDTDADTLYTPGDGLTLDGTTFSVAFSEFSCPGSDKLTGFAAGAPVCGADQQFTAPQAPRANGIFPLDAENGSGKYTSITVGPDGLPVISYQDSGSDADLRVAKCTDVGCAGPIIVTVVDTDGEVGEYSSIAIGSDGYPIISYYDLTNTALKFAKCVDAACASPAMIQVVDAGGPVERTSIAVGVDERPVMSYYDFTNADLKVAHCSDTLCTAGTNSIVDGMGALAVGQYNSIAIGTDGRPVVSYYNATDSNLWVAKCGNAECSAGNVLNVVDDGATGGVGRYNAITLGADGLPVIAYRDSNSAGLKVVRCADGACNTAATPTLVDSGGTPDIQDISITLGADALPIIAYYDAVSASLRAAKCGDPGCAANNNLVTVDTGFVGEYTSITIGADGRPIIAYRGGNRLKVAHCANPFCLPFWTRR